MGDFSMAPFPEICETAPPSFTDGKPSFPVSIAEHSEAFAKERAGEEIFGIKEGEDADKDVFCKVE